MKCEMCKVEEDLLNNRTVCRGCYLKFHNGIILDWEMCGLIAHFYKFPTLVFLLSKDKMRESMKGNQRKRIRNKKVEK